MRMLKPVVVAAAMSVVAVAAAQIPGHDPDWIVPAPASSRANPLANRPGVAAGGRKIFEQRCAACHGRDGSGTPKGPDLTQLPVQAQTDGELFWRISSGNARAGMPTFSYLPEAQRWQLVLHVRTLPH